MSTPTFEQFCKFFATECNNRIKDEKGQLMTDDVILELIDVYFRPFARVHKVPLPDELLCLASQNAIAPLRTP